MAIAKKPKSNNQFWVTDLTTTFPVEKSDLLLYFLENGSVGKTWNLNGNLWFTLTKENYKEVKELVENSKYYSDNCYVLNTDLMKLIKKQENEI